MPSFLRARPRRSVTSSSETNLDGAYGENEPTPLGVQDPGPFLHGTKADLKAGDLLEPGYSSNYGERREANYVYLTATLDAATWARNWRLARDPAESIAWNPRALSRMTQT